MRNWHERRGMALLLRGGGAALLGLAWLAATYLTGMGPGHGAQASITLRELLLAMLTFAMGSTGTALFVLGKGLFAPVTISARWQPSGRQ